MNLSPLPIQKFFDNNGEPLVGGLLFTYESGTSVKAATYTDESGLSVNTNPIVLDYRGEARVWLDPIKSYKFVLSPRGDTDPPTKPIWTVDNVTAPLSYLDLTRQIIGRIFYPRSQEEISAGITPVNYYEYYGNVLRYATNTNPGVTDMSGALAAANTVALASGLPVTITDVVHIASATSVSAPIADTLYQIFTTTSQVTLSGGPYVRPEWWGNGQNTVRYAINSLPSTGGVVQLEDKTYQTNNYSYGFGGAANSIDKDNVSIKGRKMPSFTSDCKALTGGTIIQGMVGAFANNISFSDLGVDNGFTISQTLYGGPGAAGFSDALVLTYPNDALKAAAAVRLGARLHNVIGLCYGPTTASHGIIVGEGYKNVVCTGEVIGMYGVHGVVIKCASVRAEQLTAYCNDTDGLIIKSDTQASAVSTDIQIGRVFVDASGPRGFSPYALPSSTTSLGVALNPSGNDISRLQIGMIEAYGYPTCVGSLFFAGLFSIDDVQIGQIITDQSAIGGTRLAVQVYAPSAGMNIIRWRIGSIHARNCSVGLQAFFTQPATISNHLSVGEVNCVNGSTAVQVGSAGYVDIGAVNVQNCSDAIFGMYDTPTLRVGTINKDVTTPKYYSTTVPALFPALAGTWTQFAGNDPFNVDLQGGRIWLRGLVQPGATNVVSVLPVWARPATNKRFVSQGYNGVTQGAVPITVDTSGNVKVNEVAGGTANCSTWLSLAGISWDGLA